MRAKTLILLGGATLLVGGAALLVLRGREAAYGASNERARLLPGLEARLDSVARLLVTDSSGTTTLVRSKDGWSVLEKGGYPANPEPVRATLLGLSQLRELEPKTDDPQRWSKLGVEEPGEEGSLSKLVRLEDASGASLGELVVGLARAAAGGARGGGEVYVRRPGEQRAWLAEGALELARTQKDWLQSEILKLERDRVRAVEIEHPASGESLRVARPSREVGDYEVLGLAEDQELRYPTIAAGLGGALEYVKLEDVSPAAEADLSREPLAIARFFTFDGLRVDVEVREDGARTLASFSAAYDPEGGSFQAGPPVPAGEEEPAATSERAPEEVRAEAEALNARLSPWVFAIPPYNRTNFTKKLVDLIKEPPKPADLEPEPGSDERPIVIPSHLPPEIQEQIRAHQESLGNKTVVRDVERAEEAEPPPGEEPAPEPEAPPPEEQDEAEDGAR